MSVPSSVRLAPSLWATPITLWLWHPCLCSARTPLCNARLCSQQASCLGGCLRISGSLSQESNLDAVCSSSSSCRPLCLGSPVLNFALPSRLSLQQTGSASERTIHCPAAGMSPKGGLSSPVAFSHGCAQGHLTFPSEVATAFLSSPLILCITTRAAFIPSEKHNGQCFYMKMSIDASLLLTG